MSEVTRLEARQTDAMEVIVHGMGEGLSYVEKTYQAHAWKCDGCGLVWEKKWHAATCEKREHRTRFTQSYSQPGPGPMGNATVNGIYQGTRTTYTREALRRDA